jgi:hypothetical protein
MAHDVFGVEKVVQYSHGMTMHPHNETNALKRSPGRIECHSPQLSRSTKPPTSTFPYLWTENNSVFHIKKNFGALKIQTDIPTLNKIH